MNKNKIDFALPSVEYIKEAVFAYVLGRCHGVYPEDDWFDLGNSWSVNVWSDWEPDGKLRHCHITVYPLKIEHNHVFCDTSKGIKIL